jgi:hypothetical protein
LVRLVGYAFYLDFQTNCALLIPDNIYFATIISIPVKQGVSQEDASYFLGRTYLSIVQDAERNSRDPHRFDELIKEQTPGGLNEQVSLYLFNIIIDILYVANLKTSSLVVGQLGKARSL